MKNYLFSILTMLLAFSCDTQESFTASDELTFSPLKKPGLATVTNTYQTNVRTDTLGLGRPSYYWNGETNAGIQVANGLYLITITVDDEVIASTAAIIKR
ncbi:MAG: hypothetical protein J0L62_01945 [Bacteroidetes bacterium]|nr:hypothetical protein [Bacteroidota bacterium]